MSINNEGNIGSKINFSIDNLNTMNNSETWYKELFIDNVKVVFKTNTETNINVLPLEYININSQ